MKINSHLVSLLACLCLLTGFASVLFFSGKVSAEESQLSADQDSYSSLFHEEILTVTKEQDGWLEGTFRTVLTQANGIRFQNPYTVVKIIFAPTLRHIKITKGPLPALEGSLTTLECFNPQGKVLIQYIPEEKNEADENREALENETEEEFTEEANVLTLRSNSNTIKGCHFAGASEAGLAIYGNHNVIEHNAFGLVSETASESVSEPTTENPGSGLPPPRVMQGNQGPGLKLGKDAHDNVVQHNDFIGNNGAGILLESDVGTGNHLAYNYFSKNKGPFIQAYPNAWRTEAPSIDHIEVVGEQWSIKGTCTPQSKIEVYAMDPNLAEIKDLMAELKPFEKGNSTQFYIEIPKSLITSPALVAIAHSKEHNTSEFSTAYHLPGKGSNVAEGFLPPSLPSPTMPQTPSPLSKPSFALPPAEETVIDLSNQGKGP